eukprot:CFRG2242T1
MGIGFLQNRYKAVSRFKWIRHLLEGIERTLLVITGRVRFEDKPNPVLPLMHNHWLMTEDGPIRISPFNSDKVSARAPVSTPIDTLEDLCDKAKKWQEEIDQLVIVPYRHARVKTSSANFGFTDSSSKGNEEKTNTDVNPHTNTYNEHVRRVIVCHDMSGGYCPSEKYEQGTNAANPYYIYHWQYIDTFIYFSHHLVTIPPTAIIAQCRKNCVACLGTFITEWGAGSKVCSRFLSTRKSARNVATSMSLACVRFGFDGWLLNIENPIEESLMSNLIYFIQVLTEFTHMMVKGSQVIWYDSVIVGGQLKWQNELNHANEIFMRACDGVFLNYAWSDVTLEASYNLALRMPPLPTRTNTSIVKPSIDARIHSDVSSNARLHDRIAHGRTSDVYVGIDVFGRGCFGGGGFNTHLALEKISSFRLSAAIFAPGWVYETLPVKDFDSNQSKFWFKLLPTLPFRPIVLTDLPFCTNFNMGCGLGYWLDGKCVWGDDRMETNADIDPYSVDMPGSEGVCRRGRMCWTDFSQQDKCAGVYGGWESVSTDCGLRVRVARCDPLPQTKIPTHHTHTHIYAHRRQSDSSESVCNESYVHRKGGAYSGGSVLEIHPYPHKSTQAHANTDTHDNMAQSLDRYTNTSIHCEEEPKTLHTVRVLDTWLPAHKRYRISIVYAVRYGENMNNLCDGGKEGTSVSVNVDVGVRVSGAIESTVDTIECPAESVYMTKESEDWKKISFEWDGQGFSVNPSVGTVTSTATEPNTYTQTISAHTLTEKKSRAFTLTPCASKASHINGLDLLVSMLSATETLGSWCVVVGEISIHERFSVENTVVSASPSCIHTSTPTPKSTPTLTPTSTNTSITVEDITREWYSLYPSERMDIRLRNCSPEVHIDRSTHTHIHTHNHKCKHRDITPDHFVQITCRLRWYDNGLNLNDVCECDCEFGGSSSIYYRLWASMQRVKIPHPPEAVYLGRTFDHSFTVLGLCVKPSALPQMEKELHHTHIQPSTQSSHMRAGVWIDFDLLLHGAGGVAFVLHQAETWTPFHYVLWFVMIFVGLELLSSIVLMTGKVWVTKPIAHRGKHLDTLEMLDIAYIAFNRCTAPLFVYHLLRFCWYNNDIVWEWEDMTMLNTVLAFVSIFVTYDFFYAIGHRALHHRSVYKYIHKHHHRQRAPSRGNVDAVNVHPFEFISGEYNHMLAVWLVCELVTQIHITTVVAFIALGGFLASLNHTRYDLHFPLFNSVYAVKYHDIHHWFPDSNYGQYTMLWDHVFGWFKPYPEDKQSRPTSKSKAS